MSVIFSFSTDIGSSRHTSRIIEPIVRWLIPNISETALDRIKLTVRKGGHVSEYAILAALIWRALRSGSQRGNSPKPWRRRDALTAVAIAACFAATDEWHQSWVPSREAQVSDVALDTLGASAGMMILWLGGRAFKRW